MSKKISLLSDAILTRTFKVKEPLAGKVEVFAFGIDPDEPAVIFMRSKAGCPASAEGVKYGVPVKGTGQDDPS